MPALAQHGILSKFKGQRLRIPDLSTLFKHWPGGLNPRYEELKPFVEARLER